MSLLENIELEIKKAGGRMSLAHLIIEENISLFSRHDRVFIAAQFRNTNAKKRIAEKRERSELRWKDEDVEYLLRNYGKMKCSKLARVLQRSVGSVSKKFQLTACPERKLQVPKVERGKSFQNV